MAGKLDNIRGFARIEDYVKYKLALYRDREKSFEVLFEFMFDETDNVMIETSDGYRVKKTTYGQFKQRILSIVPTLSRALDGVETGAMVGLYAANSPDWLAVFWAILAAGYRPLLMNTRLPHAVLEDLLATHGVPAVISDGELFSVKTCLLSDVTVASEQTAEARPFGTEVIFMSSGTTNNVKLCAYTGENFYYQICDSVHIVEECPEIARHYEGQIKQLALLPFYHVFGFIAVYLVRKKNYLRHIATAERLS
jgi:long-subunit acyl-CoA synthetase (AMP-forming)